MTNKRFFILPVFLLSHILVIAQYHFTTKVKDSETKETLVGATVVQKGTSYGSDLNGNVNLNFKEKGNHLLTVSYIGYKLFSRTTKRKLSKNQRLFAACCNG